MSSSREDLCTNTKRFIGGCLVNTNVNVGRWNISVTGHSNGLLFALPLADIIDIQILTN